MKMFSLEPRQIENIEFISEGNDIFVLISLRVTTQTCPHCHEATRRIHDYRQRTISHAVLNGIDTTIVYNQRRYSCMHCLKSFPEKNPFVSPGRRISKYTVLRVMTELRNPRVTFSMAAQSASISASTVISIFDAHAGIKARPFPQVLCIDEVYAIKYRQKVYACVLVDFQSNQIYDLLPGRKKYQLADYFSKIDKDVRGKVKYVSMDMWDTYRELSHLYFPNAKVCVDSFHVVKLVNHAFNQVRIRIMKGFDNKSDAYFLLKRFAWLLNKDYRDIPKGRTVRINSRRPIFGRNEVSMTFLVQRMIELDPELESAYLLKDDYLKLNASCDAAGLRDRFDAYLDAVRDFNIPEFQSVGRTLLKWREEILNSFDRVDGRRISNGPIESANGRIKVIKRNGCGYANFERFRMRVLYSLNDGSSIKF